MAKIVLGVTGSIAAYKAADLKDALIKAGHELKIVMTKSAAKLIPEAALESDSAAYFRIVDFINALTKAGYEVDVCLSTYAAKFITPITIQTVSKRLVKEGPGWCDVSLEFKGSKPEKDLDFISKFCDVKYAWGDDRHKVELQFNTAPKKLRKVYVDPFDEDVPAVVQHIDIAQWADLFLIAPLSANTLADIAVGRADSMVSLVYLAARGKPVILCPAMNTEMWIHPAVRNNLEVVLSHARNITYMEPREALLACGDSGKGAIPKTKDIVVYVETILRGCENA